MFGVKVDVFQMLVLGSAVNGEGEEQKHYGPSWHKEDVDGSLNGAMHLRAQWDIHNEPMCIYVYSLSNMNKGMVLLYCLDKGMYGNSVFHLKSCAAFEPHSGRSLLEH